MYFQQYSRSVGGHHMLLSPNSLISVCDAIHTLLRHVPSDLKHVCEVLRINTGAAVPVAELVCADASGTGQLRERPFLRSLYRCYPRRHCGGGGGGRRGMGARAAVQSSTPMSYLTGTLEFYRGYFHSPVCAL